MQQYTREFKTNFKLASPVILGMLGHTFVAFADNIMVGRLGTAELAAVSLGNSFIFIAMSLGIGFSTAITPLVAEADGAGNPREVKRTFKHGLLLCTILGIALFVAIMLARPLLHYMEQPPEVVALAMPYLSWVALSLIPLVIFQAMKQFSEGLSQTRYPMYATILANIVNIGINYVLIFGALGFPKLGVTGAAIGTLAARIAMCFILWGLFKRRKFFRPYITDIKFRVIEKGRFRKIMNLGFPSALQFFFEVAIFTAAILLSGVLGKNPQAANQIALNLSSMTFMFATGFGVAAMIRVGNQKGLKDYPELKRIAHSIFWMSALFMVGFALIFFFGRHLLPHLYLDPQDPLNRVDNLEVMAIAAELLLVSAVFQISDGLQVVILGALRGLQDVRIPTLITFIAYWVIGFPISYMLGLMTDLGSTGIWIGLLAGLTASAIMLYLRFRYKTNRLLVSSEAMV
ncbi:multidrug resistance protein, MATE family [Robiginitalea myxolifaciens]|uniref:Multidrug-efflux transporter n=1 Tax=Robiginitalea myxolifaciens TaxID=400055 RepID=A0A1I6H7Q9_9FLAO|nr:MATE family efflux transporter [Robiginitalea myxolifaciens]SFR50495.1 multidrug resistance protein, MATE family [Robiginitalea myxolifaciens]